MQLLHYLTRKGIRGVLKSAIFDPAFPFFERGLYDLAASYIVRYGNQRCFPRILIEA